MECRAHRLVADVAIIADGRVLLTRYRDVRRYDGQRGWFLPDDFLEHGEDPADGAKRICREQVGIEVAAVRLSHVESFANGAWHLIFHHIVVLDALLDPVPGSNVAAAAWFQLDALPPPADLAHDGWAAETLARLAMESAGP
jgi:ADP-ribose pyrophosphatase YjhB (NUDIX family)